MKIAYQKKKMTTKLKMSLLGPKTLRMKDRKLELFENQRKYLQNGI